MDKPIVSRAIKYPVPVAKKCFMNLKEMLLIKIEVKVN